MNSPAWYHVTNIHETDTPALLLFPDRIRQNIEVMIRIAGGAGRLRPHVKTYKMEEIVKMQMEAGINKFKCATIAEAEMLGRAGAPDVLLAYQPAGPRATRLLELKQTYPSTNFSAIIDDSQVASDLSDLMTKRKTRLKVYVDVDSGYHRTGIAPEKAFEIYEQTFYSDGLKPAGLHVYDGHIRQKDPAERKKQNDQEFRAIENLADEIRNKLGVTPEIVAGGTPSFPIHAARGNVVCSPGTVLLWDWGYRQNLPDLPFEFAAVLAARIISKPSDDLLCLDLGHKSVASENPISQRVSFLNLEVMEFIGHSEEHLVVRVKDNKNFSVGQVAFGIPHHICPTTALYERVHIVEDNRITQTWKVTARDRKITI